MMVFGVLLAIPWEIIKKKVVYYALTVGSLIGGLLIPFGYLLIGRRVDKNVWELFYKPLFSDRIQIWPQLFDLFKSFWITGIGTLYMNDMAPYRDGILDTCNAFIDLYVVYGCIVATLTLIFTAIVLLRLYDSVRKTPISKVAYAGVISFIVASYFESYIVTVPFMTMYVLAIIVTRMLANIDYGCETEISYYRSLFDTDFSKNFKRVFIPVFALAFMYCIFGPIEIFYANIDEYMFNLGTFATILIPLAVVGSVCFSLVVASVHEIIAVITGAIFSGFLLASYVQYLFFNENLVNEFGFFLDAKSLGSKYYVTNCIFFVICIAVSSLIIFYNKRDRILLYLPSVVTAIQLVALVSITIPILMYPRKGQYIRILGTDTEFEIAEDENIIVLMLDTFGRNYLEEINEQWPEKTDFLHDFTYYQRANSIYAPTFPALVHMLTDAEYENDMKRREYERNAFESEKSKMLFETLHLNGYETDLYTTDLIMDKYLDDIFDNVKIIRKKDNINSILTILLKQSMYRYMPYCVKAPFEWIQNDIKYTYAYEAAPQYYLNYVAYDYLCENGLHVNETLGKKFSYIHFEGAHSYPNNDENCNKVPMSSVSQTTSGAGSLKMVEKYIEELKRLDKYDSSVIIVLADHGDGENKYNPIFFIKNIGECHSKINVNDNEFSYCEFGNLIGSIIEDSN